MQEYASCNMNSTSSYMTTNHTHNNIHSCLSVCWLYMYVNCTLDPVSAFLDKIQSVFTRSAEWDQIGNVDSL